MASRPVLDPRLAAITARPSEPALPGPVLLPDRLTEFFRRAAADAAFPNWSPELTHDRRRPVSADAAADTVPAAVLVAITTDAQVPQVVLTTRTSHLASHAGQISFPGGRAEPHDESPKATALREAQEEIGLDISRVQILGSLPNYFTITGYQVTPVVGLISGPAVFTPDPYEVEDVFCVPLEFLMNPANHQLRVLTADQSPTQASISFYAMPYRCPLQGGREFFIWGATAAMIRNFYHFLAAASAQSSSI